MCLLEGLQLSIEPSLFGFDYRSSTLFVRHKDEPAIGEKLLIFDGDFRVCRRLENAGNEALLVKYWLCRHATTSLTFGNAAGTQSPDFREFDRRKRRPRDNAQSAKPVYALLTLP